LEFSRRDHDHRCPTPLRFLRSTIAYAFCVLGALGFALWELDIPGLNAQCGANATVCENLQAGAPSSEWDITGAGDTSLQGFATDISVNHGTTIGFKVDTTAQLFPIDIYRLGYYGGMGARKVASLPGMTGRSQPACLKDTTTGLIDCGNWTQSAAWAVPSTAVSGIYIARLSRPDTGGASHIVFVVRDDQRTSDLLVQTSDTTWQAYNRYGGNSLYVGAPATNPARAYKVSYNRPFTTRLTTPEDWLFNAEYPMLRWLEANGYDVAYAAGRDIDRDAALIPRHKAFLSVGHDEYWSGAQRAHVESARAAGVHLAFFSGNEMFWKTRWEQSIDGSATSYRTLVSYKETHANAPIDPMDPSIWTGTWRDPRFSPPADGGRPENAVSGTIFTANCCTSSLAINVPYAFASLRFWRNTRVAALQSGQSAVLAAGTLGYEWDEDLDNGARPTGLMKLSTTTASLSMKLQDQGSTYGPGTATHSLTLYRHSSGALVFSAGTVQWAWGLDATHDRTASVPDAAMQQAMVNLLADMSSQPGSLQSGLIAASSSVDTLAPTSTVVTPASGSHVTSGVAVTVTGTATDAGSGSVAGVEVTTDGGLTWHPASGGASWSYVWTPAVVGTTTVMSRAIDDSGNVEAPTSGRTVTVVAAGQCPCSIWPSSWVPSSIETADHAAVELGVRFRSDVAGNVTAIRFFKGTGNGGTHTGHLWTNAGSLLASVTFSSETASGWQTASLSAPVAITANTTYVVSYHTDQGNYAVEANLFATSGVDAVPLHALANGVDGANGVFRYGTSAFPTNTYQSSNYGVDLVFDTTASSPPPNPPPASGCPCSIWSSSSSPAVIESGDKNAVELGLRFRADSDGAVSGVRFYKATGSTGTHVGHLWTNSGTLLGSVTFANETTSGWQVASFTSPIAVTANTTYVVSYYAPAGVYAVDAGTFASSGVDTPPLHALANGVSGANGVYRYGASAFPTSFYQSSNYWVDVVYQPSGPDVTPPTVVGRVPAPNQTNVATGSAVSVTFSEPMNASTVSFGVRNGTGTVVAGSSSYNAQTNTATWSPAQAFSTSTTYTVTVPGGAGGAKDVAGNPLAANDVWSFTTVAPTPPPSSGCPCSIWTSTASPAHIETGDQSAVEVGVRFKADVNGTITALRFYKAPTNTGVHTGHLWSASGTLLASITFSGETASGWQQATLSTPVAITANTAYVASYYTTVGNYAADARAFVVAVDAAPLHAVADASGAGNGVYRYGASAFPASSYLATNYWVDVVFVPSN